MKGDGPAFPQADDATTGMFLRDYFAAQALAGWMAGYQEIAPRDVINVAPIAELAYRIADAMLEARK